MCGCLQAECTVRPSSCTKPRPISSMPFAPGSSHISYRPPSGDHLTLVQPRKLDKGAFAPCTSPKSYKVKPGKHTFSVEAVSAGGTDPTPASFSFKVKKIV